MAGLVVFAPTVVEMRKKGRMIMFYDMSGPGDAEHICSFFHEHKANWAAKAFEDSGTKVLIEGAAKPKSNGAKKVRKIKR